MPVAIGVPDNNRFDLNTCARRCQLTLARSQSGQTAKWLSILFRHRARLS